MDALEKKVLEFIKGDSKAKFEVAMRQCATELGCIAIATCVLL